MSMNYLNYIQLALGLWAAASVFVGIFLPVKKLKDEESTEKIPTKTLVIATGLILLGLLLYAGVKTCTFLTVETEEQYGVMALYFTALVEVAKTLGFLVLIPALFRIFKRSNDEKQNKKSEDKTKKADA